MTTLSFFVPGHPVTQGSKRVGMGRNGRMYIYEAFSDRLKVWRTAVSTIARDHFSAMVLSPEGALPIPCTGPVSVRLMFQLRQAKSNKDEHPVGRSAGDLDKLTRAVLDALTDAGVWYDDSQVCRLQVSKHYSMEPGVRVTVRAFREPLPVIPTAEIRTPVAT